MKRLPKKCDILKIEEEWQKKWEKLGIYHFDYEDLGRPVFTIDTPPPYPSGEFHMGNVLNWTYFDIVARYKRMSGYNVHFPQGWDCHGLPTEVRTEERYGLRKTEVDPLKFRDLCVKTVSEYIDIMKRAIIRLGCSVDWTTEYRTMDPSYWRKTQLSFLILYKKGYIYQGTHPINWCPRCETAIADAEVEHETREGRLFYLKFPFAEDDGYIPIATTRPELLMACVAVAVNPEDDRYKGYVGKKVRPPLVDRDVTIITDDMVDPEFGTGAVMICTYGDKADVKCVVKNKLPVIMCIDERGRMNEKAGRYQGLTIQEAKETIAQELKEKGFLDRVERVQQEVGICWRCKTPIEILERKQWFMKTRTLTPTVVKAAKEIKWYPDYMRTRLIDWAQSLDWDWVISRQRIFATPIPIWYCKDCGEIILAEEEWLPIDPRAENPRIEKCPRCGGSRFQPERDVLDTWFDSSISCAVHAGWPDRRDWRRLFPASIHPSGTDIIRTWAYYLMVRHLALFDEVPYRSVLINGMVLGSDGRKMSKSLGNYIATSEVFEKYGADAARQWAACGGATGSDIPFRWADVEYGWRFLIKLWNASVFASIHLANYKPEGRVEPTLLDKWLESKLEKVKMKVTGAMERYQFNLAVEEVRNFIWHVLCDNYIEAIKHRLYNPELYGEDSRLAAQQTLYRALYEALQLLAPVCPHVTEEIYHHMYSEDKGYKSIHLSPWPNVEKSRISPEAERKGDLVIAVISALRREKAEKRMPLNMEIPSVLIFAEDEEKASILKEAEVDLKGTCKIKSLRVLTESGEGKPIQAYPGIHFIFGS